MRRLFARSEEPVSVMSAMASTRPVVGEEFLGDVHQLGGDALALEILDGLDVGVLLYAENPARFQGSRLAVYEVADFDDIAGIFENPVVAGESAIKEALFDVPAYLLGADETAVEFGVVDRGLVGTGTFGDSPARLGKKRYR